MTVRLAPGSGSDPTYLVNVTAGSESYALPAAFAPGRRITFTRTDGTSNTFTLTVAAGQSLNGTTDGTITVSARSQVTLSPSDPGVWVSFTYGGGGEGGTPADGSITTAKLGSSVPSDLATNAAFTGTYATGVTLGSVTGATATDRLNAAISAAASLYGNRAFIDLQGASIAITGVTLGSYTKLRNGRITRSGTGTGPLLTIPDQASLQATEQLVLENLDIDGVTSPAGTTPNGSVGLLVNNHAAAILNNVNVRRCDTGIVVSGAQFAAANRVKAWDCNIGLYQEARVSGGGGNSWSWYDFQAIGCKVGLVMNNLFDGPQAAVYFRNPSILDSKICAAAFFGVSQARIDGSANENTGSAESTATYTYTPPTGAAALTVKRSSFYLKQSHVEISGYCAEAQMTPVILAESASVVTTGDFSGYGLPDGSAVDTDATSQWVLSGAFNCVGAAGIASAVAGPYLSGHGCLVGPPILLPTTKMRNQIDSPQVPTFTNELDILSDSIGSDALYGRYRAIQFAAIAGGQGVNRMFMAVPTGAGETSMAVSFLVQASVDTSLQLGLAGNIGNRYIKLRAGRWQRVVWTMNALTASTSYTLIINEIGGAGATVKFACAHLMTGAAAGFDQNVAMMARGGYNPNEDNSTLFAPTAGASQQFSLPRAQAKMAAITNAPPARFRWLTYGDSYAQKIYGQIWSTLAVMCGGGAGAYGTQNAPIVGGVTINGTTGTITAPSDYTYWPTGGGELYATGATRTYGAGGGSFIGDTIKVYYAKDPSFGTFKIQVDGTDASGFTNISAAGTVGSLGIATLSVAAGAHTVTVVNLTGTHRIVCIGYENSTVSGLVSINVSQGGIPLNAATSTAYSNFQAFLSDVAPNLVTLEVKENSSYYPAALTTLFGIIAAGAPTADLLGIGSTPVLSGDEDQVKQNTQLAAATAAAGYKYWDSYAPFGSYAKLVALGWQGDGIHVTAEADQYRGMLMLRDTGLLNTFGRTLIQGGPRLTKMTFGRLQDQGYVGLIQPEQSFGFDLELRTGRRFTFKNLAGTEGACLDFGGASASWMPNKLRISGATGLGLWALNQTRLAVMRGDDLNKVADVQAKTFVMDSSAANTTGAVTLDLAESCAYQLTLTGNVTSLAFSNPPGSGALIEIHFIQDGTGSRTLAGVNSQIKFAGGTIPTLTTTASKRDIFVFRQVAGPTWVEVSRSLNVG